MHDGTGGQYAYGVIFGPARGLSSLLPSLKNEKWEKESTTEKKKHTARACCFQVGCRLPLSVETGIRQRFASRSRFGTCFKLGGPNSVLEGKAAGHWRLVVGAQAVDGLSPYRRACWAQPGPMDQMDQASTALTPGPGTQQDQAHQPGLPNNSPPMGLP